MLRFSLFGFPISVDWWFWIVTALLGGGLSARDPEDWTSVGIWIAVVFVSITVHELGHAFMARRFGVQPMIHLHGFGGATFLPGANFSRSESIQVSFAGPAAGFALGILFLIVYVLVDKPLESWAASIVAVGLYVNIFWTFVNLLPIQPLDGGQILRDVLGPSRRKLTAIIGGCLAAVVALVALKYRMPFAALFFALFAFNNFTQQTGEGGVIKG